MSNAPVSAPATAFRSRRLGLLFAIVVMLYFAAYAWHPALLVLIGINHYGPWFLDTFALLASNDAIGRGLDPYQPNPLDYFHRPHVYSHWWLHLRDVGLTRADTFWLGLGIVLIFLVAALARLRPQNGRQFLWYLAVIASGPVVLAIDRANNDLIIFSLLALLVPCLRSRHRGFRLLAPWLVALSAVLKYYPAAAGLVLLAGRGDRVEGRSRLIITGLLLACAALVIAPGLANFGSLTPKPTGLLTFGATGLFAEFGWTGLWPVAVCSLAGIAVIAVVWRRRPLGEWTPFELLQADWLHFILGAALLTGCFFTGLNYGYRWIFALWMAPFLWRPVLEAEIPAGVQRLAGSTRWLLIIVLWWDTFWCLVLNSLMGIVSVDTLSRYAQYCYLAEQPLDWALFGSLLVFLTQFVRLQTGFLFGAKLKMS